MVFRCWKVSLQTGTGFIQRFQNDVCQKTPIQVFEFIKSFRRKSLRMKVIVQKQRTQVAGNMSYFLRVESIHWYDLS